MLMKCADRFHERVAYPNYLTMMKAAQKVKFEEIIAKTQSQEESRKVFLQRVHDYFCRYMKTFGLRNYG